ncbi:MAG: hypothetical protein NC916_02610, partial [Candidatus Omnitrophica bacterium]|nr:hypothetical protein [Candidatus Omnitrophota bacterium]
MKYPSKGQAENKFSIDANNQLIIRPPGEKPRTASGKFQIDKQNQLFYWLNEPPVWRRKYSLPPKIAFEGTWKLNR